MNASIYRRPRRAASVRQQSGFTLIEVLVSALILAIGLVGVAGLQALSLKNNQSSFMRSQATALAYELADRVRANMPSAVNDQYDPAVKAMTAGCMSTVGCTPQQMAQHDMAEWDAAIAARLPMGEGFICRDSTPNDGTGSADAQCDGAGDQITVKIWWDDDRDGVITISPTITERLVITFRM